MVDEVQFLHPKHIDVFRQIADLGCPVICYGLRTDFRRNLFAGAQRLFELADTVEEVKTTCYYCNRKAIFNLKLVNGKGTLSGAQVELGCEELYLPTCSHHFTEKTLDETTNNINNDNLDDNTQQQQQQQQEGLQSDIDIAIATVSAGLSSKNNVLPTDIESMTIHSRNAIMALRRLVAIDNKQNPDELSDEYQDPLVQ